jgi:hypothetical protein
MNIIDKIQNILIKVFIFADNYVIINTYRIPNPYGFVIDVFIDIGVKQSR